MEEEIPKRNVHVFSASDGKEVAGFFQHGGVSISTFVKWINDVCYIPVDWTLYPCQFDNNRAIGGEALDSTSTGEIQPGRYVIQPATPESEQISVFLTPDTPRARAFSGNYTYTPDDTNFVKRIRSRDARCCITGERVPGGVASRNYTGFEAAHIFPLNETDIWNGLGYKRFIQDDEIDPGFELNSIQQGFLCSSTEHRLFGEYSIGVNPADGYRIYDFVGRDPSRSPHGKFFYRKPGLEQRYLPSPELLRDHFHQCILRHVKGAAEATEPERYFDPDIDLGAGGFNLVTGSWWSSSNGKKQLEAELAGRLWGVVNAQNRLQSSSDQQESQQS
ncbi:hypothetical protein CPB83DRAFT_863366 [Crepidotus variabilis]|uniref:HNH nuclease domain-containing protein n=1 Tax=Crepidotus variabilis TaxID=179855 RepID=A0A9P6E673_9AGAR|nr:hypothetical protein CPB83DRAFT_863366 [Crepidotus variabilis]